MGRTASFGGRAALDIWWKEALSVLVGRTLPYDSNVFGSALALDVFLPQGVIVWVSEGLEHSSLTYHFVFLFRNPYILFWQAPMLIFRINLSFLLRILLYPPSGANRVKHTERGK